MSELTPRLFEDHHEYIFKCDCTDAAHFLEVCWDEQEKNWRYLTIYDFYKPRTWRDKFRLSWKLFRGHQANAAYVMLTQAAVDELIEVLSKHSKSDD